MFGTFCRGRYAGDIMLRDVLLGDILLGDILPGRFVGTRYLILPAHRTESFRQSFYFLALTNGMLYPMMSSLDRFRLLNRLSYLCISSLVFV